MQKRRLTLLELFLALAILSIVMGALFSQLKELSLLSVRAEKKLNETLEISGLHERLSNLFHHLISCRYENGILSFRTAPLIDPDPHFCTSLDGTLSIDHESLLLNLTPEKTEVLKKKSLSFSCTFITLEKGRYIETKEWKKEELPSALLIHIDGKSFPFFTENKPGEIHL